MSVDFAPMRADDALTIQRQASQLVQLGLERQMSREEAEALAADEAWTASTADGRIVACIGLKETFPGVQAVAWAIFAEGIGGAHLAITRFARARIVARSRPDGLARIEAIVRASVPAECAWARLVGLTPAHLLRKFGAASEDHVLYERIATSPQSGTLRGPR